MTRLHSFLYTDICVNVR